SLRAALPISSISGSNTWPLPVAMHALSAGNTETPTRKVEPLLLVSRLPSELWTSLIRVGQPAGQGLPGPHAPIVLGQGDAVLVLVVIGAERSISTITFG